MLARARERARAAATQREARDANATGSKVEEPTADAAKTEPTPMDVDQPQRGGAPVVLVSRARVQEDEWPAFLAACPAPVARLFLTALRRLEEPHTHIRVACLQCRLCVYGNYM